MMLLRAPVTVLLSDVNSEPILLMAGAALTTFVTVTVSIPSRSSAAAAAAGPRRPARSPPTRLAAAAADAGPQAAALGVEGRGSRTAGAWNGG